MISLGINYSQTVSYTHLIYMTDNRKAEKVLGWKPKVGISEGYDRILAWIRENEKDLRQLYAAAQPQSAGAK